MMCEKCWRDSATGPYGDHAEAYAKLLRERDASDKPCTLREQAGDYWDEAKQCDSRLAARGK